MNNDAVRMALQQYLAQQFQGDPRREVWQGPMSPYARPEGSWSTLNAANRQWLASQGVVAETPEQTRAKMLEQERLKQGTFSDEHILKALAPALYAKLMGLKR